MNKKNTVLRVIASLLATILLCLVILVIIFFGKDSIAANSSHGFRHHFPNENFVNQFSVGQSGRQSGRQGEIELPKKRQYDIEVPFGKVNILTTDTKKPYIEVVGEEDIFTKHLYFDIIEVNDDECNIKIEFRGFGFRFLKNFNLDAFKQEINIYLPKNLDKLDVSLDAGVLNISDITAKKLELSVDAGNSKVTDCDFGEITAQVDAGNLEMEIGDAKKVDADVDVGNFNLYIPKDTKGFAIKYKTSLGNIADKTGLDLKFGYDNKEGFNIDKIGSITYENADKGTKIDLSVDVGNVSLYTY